MHTPRLLAAAAAAAALTVGLAGPSHAALDLDLTKTDATGDVDTMTANTQPAIVKNSIDIETVTYRIDRDTKTLKAIYRTPTIFTHAQLDERNITQSFSTVIVDGDTTFTIESTSRHRKVVTIDDEGKTRTCAKAKSRTNPKADTLTQKVPFSCIDPTEGGFMSGTFLITSHGPLFRDVGSWITHAYDI